MSENKFIETGLTFDDVLLVPSYSEILPSGVKLISKFSRNLSLKVPIVSAAMDTVTGILFSTIFNFSISYFILIKSSISFSRYDVNI